MSNGGVSARNSRTFRTLRRRGLGVLSALFRNDQRFRRRLVRRWARRQRTGIISSQADFDSVGAFHRRLSQADALRGSTDLQFVDRENWPHLLRSPHRGVPSLRIAYERKTGFGLHFGRHRTGDGDSTRIGQPNGALWSRCQSSPSKYYRGDKTWLAKRHSREVVFAVKCSLKFPASLPEWAIAIVSRAATGRRAL